MAARIIALTLLCLASVAGEASVDRRTVNDGQMVLEDIPPIPPGLGPRLSRYQALSATQMLAWSADGESLFARGRHRGVNQVQFIAERGAQPRQVTQLREPVREVARQHGGNLLAFTLSTGGRADDQLFLLNPDSGEVRQLTDTPGTLNNRMIWDRDDQRLAFRSTRRNARSNDIWIMDVDAPEEARLVLAAPDGALWRPVAFNRAGDQLLVQQYSSITDSRVHLLDLDSGTLRLLVGSEAGPTSNVAVGFDEDERGVFFVSNLRGRAAEIGWAPLAEEAPIRWVDVNIRWDVTAFELSPDGRRGAFVTNEHGASQLYHFDPKRLRFHKARNVPLGVINDLRFSPDGRRLGFTLSTPTSPGDVYAIRYSRWGNYPSTPRPWSGSDRGTLDPDALITPDLFAYPAPGRSPDETFYIPGFRYLPKGPGPHPVVIYIHGGPEGQFRPGFNRTVQLWAAELGVAVVAPNVRGSLGYGRAYVSLDDGKRREDAVRDIGALLDWIAETPELDENRVAVYGASYGGYMALASAVHYSDRLTTAVARAGISNFVTYLERTGEFRRDLRRAEYGDERDPEMRAFLESISPLNNVDRIAVPLLIAQGQNDPVVPASESEQMVRALRERGQTVWYLNALNEGHGYEKKANRDVYDQVTYLFFERYLLGR